MNEYFKYQEQLNKLVEKKQKLEETDGLRLAAYRDYIKYKEEAEKLRHELMNLIPSKFI